MWVLSQWWSRQVLLEIVVSLGGLKWLSRMKGCVFPVKEHWSEGVVGDFVSPSHCHCFWCFTFLHYYYHYDHHHHSSHYCCSPWLSWQCSMYWITCQTLLSKCWLQQNPLWWPYNPRSLLQQTAWSLKQRLWVWIWQGRSDQQPGFGGSWFGEREKNLLVGGERVVDLGRSCPLQGMGLLL